MGAEGLPGADSPGLGGWFVLLFEVTILLNSLPETPRASEPVKTACSVPSALTATGFAALTLTIVFRPPGPRRRVLELADALAGAAYFFARTVDDEPAMALTRLRSAGARFTGQLLEAAQALHDDALTARAPRSDDHLDAAPAHLDTPDVRP
jgi:hypothetical protein